MSKRIKIRRDALAPGQATRVDAGATSICVAQVGNRYFAIGDRCTHADVSLSEGEIDESECSIECWKHGSAFSLIDGVPLSLPATTPVPVYQVEIDNEHVVVTVP